MIKPRYPVYVISKGRHDCCLTANFLLRDNVHFKIVIEPQEVEQYRQHYDQDHLLLLPFSNLGLGSIPARNWVWEHAISSGHQRHWILDDNIARIRRHLRGKRIPCDANVALACMEQFTDRYTNIAISGSNYSMFTPGTNTPSPYWLNVHVYSCLLIRNDLPYRWRGRYNEDTDLSLQVLANGWSTVLFNAFTIDKMRTMTMKGGNTTELYRDDGRLRMARSLERIWPYVVETKRRFKRPQHHIKKNWRGFDTQLIRRTDIDWNNLPDLEQTMHTVMMDEIKSEGIKALHDEFKKAE